MLTVPLAFFMVFGTQKASGPVVDERSSAFLCLAQDIALVWLPCLTRSVPCPKRTMSTDSSVCLSGDLQPSASNQGGEINARPNIAVKHGGAISEV